MLLIAEEDKDYISEFGDVVAVDSERNSFDRPQTSLGGSCGGSSGCGGCGGGCSGGGGGSGGSGGGCRPGSMTAPCL